MKQVRACTHRSKLGNFMSIMAYFKCYKMIAKVNKKDGGIKIFISNQ